MNRPPLSPETIFRAALELVDREGLEALTMRRLATELGVATMSLYGHVQTKDDLIFGVLNMTTAEMQLPGPETPPWDALRSICREFRRVALMHPALIPVIAAGPPAGPDSLRTLEAALDAIRLAGIDPARTAQAYRRMASFAIGFVFLEAGGFFRPIEEGAGGDAALDQLRAMPRIMETAPHLATWDSDAEFEAGMTAVIDSLSAGT